MGCLNSIFMMFLMYLSVDSAAGVKLVYLECGTLPDGG